MQRKMLPSCHFCIKISAIMCSLIWQMNRRKKINSIMIFFRYRTELISLYVLKQHAFSKQGMNLVLFANIKKVKTGLWLAKPLINWLRLDYEADINRLQNSLIVRDLKKTYGFLIEKYVIVLLIVLKLSYKLSLTLFTNFCKNKYWFWKFVHNGWLLMQGNCFLRNLDTPQSKY